MCVCVYVCVCLRACVHMQANVCSVPQSCLFATPWTVVHQAPLSIGFPRQEYWNGLPFPSPGDLPHPGIEHMSPMSPELAGRFFTTEPRRKPSRGQCIPTKCESCYPAPMKHCPMLMEAQLVPTY